MVYDHKVHKNQPMKEYQLVSKYPLHVYEAEWLYEL